MGEVSRGIYEQEKRLVAESVARRMSIFFYNIQEPRTITPDEAMKIVESFIEKDQGKAKTEKKGKADAEKPEGSDATAGKK